MQEKRITRVEFPARAVSPGQPLPRKRVAAYARVSTMKDAQENSLQSQRYVSDAADLIIRQLSFQIHSFTLLHYREFYR